MDCHPAFSATAGVTPPLSGPSPLDLAAALEQAAPPGVVDLVPAKETLLVVFDPALISAARLRNDVPDLGTPKLFRIYRDLRFSNQLPVEHMWRVIEPRIESVRRELAKELGVTIGKDLQQADWGERPLDAERVAYLETDVRLTSDGVVVEVNARVNGAVVGRAERLRQSRVVARTDRRRSRALRQTMRMNQPRKAAGSCRASRRFQAVTAASWTASSASVC